MFYNASYVDSECQIRKVDLPANVQSEQCKGPCNSPFKMQEAVMPPPFPNSLKNPKSTCQRELFQKRLTQVNPHNLQLQ